MFWACSRDLFEFGLDIHDVMRDLRVHGLRRDRVRFAAHLLQKKIEFSADGLARRIPKASCGTGADGFRAGLSPRLRRSVPPGSPFPEPALPDRAVPFSSLASASCIRGPGLFDRLRGQRLHASPSAARSDRAARTISATSAVALLRPHGVQVRPARRQASIGNGSPDRLDVLFFLCHGDKPGERRHQPEIRVRPASLNRSRMPFMAGTY